MGTGCLCGGWEYLRGRNTASGDSDTCEHRTGKGSVYRSRTGNDLLHRRGTDGTTDRLPGAGTSEMDTGGEGGKGRCGDKDRGQETEEGDTAHRSSRRRIFPTDYPETDYGTGCRRGRCLLCPTDPPADDGGGEEPSAGVLHGGRPAALSVPRTALRRVPTFPLQGIPDETDGCHGAAEAEQDAPAPDQRHRMAPGD